MAEGQVGRIGVAVAALSVLLAGCGRTPPVEIAAPAPLPVQAAPRPVPPAGAVADMTIPARLADGGYATPNRDLSNAAAAWHLRAALNVAALGCANDALVPGYNALIKSYGAQFAASHRTLAAEYGDQARFDSAMTRLYNYFALPPVAPAFCQASAQVLGEIQAAPPADLTDYAAPALARIDAPFQRFFAAYDQYRVKLAAWTPDAVPRLGYAQTVFAPTEVVTGGAVRVATR